MDFETLSSLVPSFPVIEKCHFCPPPLSTDKPNVKSRTLSKVWILHQTQHLVLQLYADLPYQPCCCQNKP